MGYSARQASDGTRSAATGSMGDSDETGRRLEDRGDPSLLRQMRRYGDTEIRRYGDPHLRICPYPVIVQAARHTGETAIGKLSGPGPTPFQGSRADWRADGDWSWTLSRRIDPLFRYRDSLSRRNPCWAYCWTLSRRRRSSFVDS